MASEIQVLKLQSYLVVRSKRMVLGMPSMKKFSQCESCVFGKQHRSAHPNRKTLRAEERLVLIHTDLYGPM